MLYDVLHNLTIYVVQRTKPKQSTLSSNKKIKLTELVEDDLWLESNIGKQSCAQTHLGTTKSIVIERVSSRLPLMHGKPALSHVNRQVSGSSTTALQRKNGHVVSNDDKSVILLHKQAKKQPPMSGVFVHAQDLQEANGAPASQLISKTRRPNTSLVEGNSTRWSEGTSKHASSSSLLQCQASVGTYHDTTANGQRDGSRVNHQEAKNLDGTANALVAPNQQFLKQRKMTSRGGVLLLQKRVNYLQQLSSSGSLQNWVKTSLTWHLQGFLPLVLL